MFETQITFDHSLYNTQALDLTSEAYGDHMSVSFSHGDSSTEGKFTVEGDDGALIVDAFCNHVLFLTIQSYRQGSEA